jgi:hypothetical protein
MQRSISKQRQKPEGGSESSFSSSEGLRLARPLTARFFAGRRCGPAAATFLTVSTKHYLGWIAAEFASGRLNRWD